MPKVDSNEPSLQKHTLLVLGMGPNAYHLLAGGFAQQIGDPSVEVVSAAMQVVPPPRAAVEVMERFGIDIAAVEVRTPVDIEVFSFDMVVTVGEFDPSCRPNLPGMPPHYHWDLPEPFDAADEAQEREMYETAARFMFNKIELVLRSDMLHGLSIARRNLELVIDNLAHAVMAHTINRRIFYFNHAAEQITGYSRDELLGKDCHEVFRPKRFCGGDCSFCKDATGSCGDPHRQVTFTRKDGSERVLDMTVNPLRDASGVDVGALVSFQDNTELHVLKHRIHRHQSLRGMVGADTKMIALFEQIREVAAVNVPVLIQGESGTGKELIATAIHEESPRAEKPFVPVNCGALPEGILESELFGHVRGAFTGAINDKRGRFELADGGTLFLDEVGELTPAMQVKLLRVLQDQSFERVGSERRIHVDVRIISATNQDLRKLMEQKVFRRDLYYRLCVVPITPPPLRDRRRDISILIDHFLEEISRETGQPALTVSREALDILLAYDWPGNVRELRNAVEYFHVKCRTGVITPAHLPTEITSRVAHRTSRRGRRGPLPKLDRAAVTDALIRAEGNKSRAAKLLGVGRTTLYRYLESYEKT